MDLQPAQLVGKAFVKEYYYNADKQVSVLPRFYTNDSKLSRPNANGIVVPLTTEEAMRQNILSIGDGMQVKIETVDSHDSHENGYLIVVRGFTVSADRVMRRFTQTFFLATLGHPALKRLYVLNDIFRFEDSDYQQRSHGHETPLSHDDQYVQEQQVLVQDAKVVTREDTHVSLVNEDVSVTEVAAPVTPVKEVLRAVPTVQTKQIPPLIVSGSSRNSTVLGAAEKSTYASLVKVPKESPDTLVFLEKTQPNPPAQAKLPAPSNPPAQATLPALSNPPAQANPPALSKPLPQANLQAPSKAAHVVSSNGGENNYQQEADAYSIVVRNLSVYVTRKKLQEIFQEFGVVKISNIQLKINNAYGTCCAFLQFEDCNAVYRAIRTIQDFPLWLDGRPIYVSRKFSNGPRGGAAAGGRGSVSWRSQRGDQRDIDNSRSNGRNQDFNKGNYRRDGSSESKSTVKVDHSNSNGGSANNGGSGRGVPVDYKVDVKVDNSSSIGVNGRGSGNGGIGHSSSNEKPQKYSS